MNIENIILVVVLAAILGAAALYVYRAKKQGKRCIGCPDGASCCGQCTGCRSSEQ